jgi:hypothetical protein
MQIENTAFIFESIGISFVRKSWFCGTTILDADRTCHGAVA